MITSCFGHSGTYLSPVADTEKKTRKEFESASINLEMTTTQYSHEKILRVRMVNVKCLDV